MTSPMKNAASAALLAEYARTRDPDLRDQIILEHEPLVHSVARRFARPWAEADDLTQTAWVALIGAVDRYDPAHNNQFTTYAVCCMVGAIKRYFRDQTWIISVPRQLIELNSRMHRAQEALAAALGREPTPGEIADALGVPEETVLEAMEARLVYRPLTLEPRAEEVDASESRHPVEVLGGPDPDLDAVVEHAPLRTAVGKLDERLRTLIHRRFFEGRTQQQVADDFRVSQMQISRLERRTLATLRSALEGTA